MPFIQSSDELYVSIMRMPYTPTFSYILISSLEIRNKQYRMFVKKSLSSRIRLSVKKLVWKL